MPYCPHCGAEVEEFDRYCYTCGKPQGTATTRVYTPEESYRPPPSRKTSGGVKYDDLICLILCCCLSPIAALIYYLLTDHEPDEPQQQYEKYEYEYPPNQ